jgi:pantoate--beta-alanine ligase
METHTRWAAARARLARSRAAGRTVGLVPTMGYLHDGHASLVERAAGECDEVVVTVFVNPLQFAAGEDLASYPRDPEGDAARAEAAGCTLLVVPDDSEMYPRPVLTTVAVPDLAGVMEGASRPTHFAGVCTVVAKLFHLVTPDRAYFGEKDFQQLAIVRRMAEDLSFPVEVVGCPTVREPDGLARSSRNVYLTPDEREVAPVLHRALRTGAAAIRTGERDADAVRRTMAEVVRAAPLGELDYVEVADPETLRPLERCDEGARLFGAVRFGRARLIDNVGAGDAS